MSHDAGTRGRWLLALVVLLLSIGAVSSGLCYRTHRNMVGPLAEPH